MTKNIKKRPITFNVTRVFETTRLTEQGRNIKSAEIILPHGCRTWIDIQRRETPYFFEFEGKTYYISEKEYLIYKKEFQQALSF
jgi:YHS domain-containing protein